MITELEIEGFKSFGSPAEKIELGPLSFIVGANASGKTNLLHALRFLQNAINHDVPYAVSELGGSAEARNKRLYQDQPLRLAIKVEKEFKGTLSGSTGSQHREDRVATWSFEYKLGLDLGSNETTPSIEEESLCAEVVRDAETSTATLTRDSKEISFFDPLLPIGRGKQPHTITVPEQLSTRLALADAGFLYNPAAFLCSEIRDWHFYNIIPGVARQPYREQSDAGLGSAGENLATILHRMTAEDRASIAQGLRSIVPGFKDLKTAKLPIEDTLAFQIVEDNLNAAINPISVSDGTVRLLALLVLTTWTARNSSLIAVEEPENGIHPHLSENIVDMLRSASEHSQLIVTTHEPDLLDHVEPSEVILCDKEDGFTRLRKASSVADIEQFREHFSLGELWEQGVVGAIPRESALASRDPPIGHSGKRCCTNTFPASVLTSAS